MDKAADVNDDVDADAVDVENDTVDSDDTADTNTTTADGDDTAETPPGRPCPLCGASMQHRHCKYICPTHGVVYDCADTFY